jgi:hypothetical protein
VETPRARPAAGGPAAPGAIPGWGQAATLSPTSPSAAPAPVAARTPAAPPPPPPLPPSHGTPPVAPIAAQQPSAVRPTAAIAAGAAAAGAASTAASVPGTAAPSGTQPASRSPNAADEGIQSRKPQDVVRPTPKPVPTISDRVAQPGDRICGACSEANDPSRKFCRRCGTSLVEAKVVAAAALPWYRRIFRGGKQTKQYAAGERIDSMQKGSAKAPRKGVGAAIAAGVKSVGLVRGLLGLVVMLGIFGYIGIPSVRGMVEGAVSGGPQKIVDNIRKAIAPTPQIVIPTAITASSEVDGHPATMVWDQATNTDWQGNDKAPTLTVTFKDKIDLMFLIVFPGNATEFKAFRRPSKIEVVFPDGTSQTVDLAETKDKQPFPISKDGIDSLQIRILETTGPDTAPISISELEFNKKS